jgi:hypothetical protein
LPARSGVSEPGATIQPRQADPAQGWWRLAGRRHHPVSTVRRSSSARCGGGCRRGRGARSRCRRAGRSGPR